MKSCLGFQDLDNESVSDWLFGDARQVASDPTGSVAPVEVAYDRHLPNWIKMEASKTREDGSSDVNFVSGSLFLAVGFGVVLLDSIELHLV